VGGEETKTAHRPLPTIFGGKIIVMKESFLRVGAWLSLSLLIVSSLASAAIAADGDCDQSAATIYQTASPAVVFISATSINPYRVADRVEHIVGFGFIIDAEGLALTNSHVVFGRQSLTVRLSDGTTLPARLLGADPIFDIAVLWLIWNEYRTRRAPAPPSSATPIARRRDPAT